MSFNYGATTRMHRSAMANTHYVHDEGAWRSAEQLPPSRELAELNHMSKHNLPNNHHKQQQIQQQKLQRRAIHGLRPSSPLNFSSASIVSATDFLDAYISEHEKDKERPRDIWERSFARASQRKSVHFANDSALGASPSPDVNKFQGAREEPRRQPPPQPHKQSAHPELLDHFLEPRGSALPLQNAQSETINNSDDVRNQLSVELARLENERISLLRQEESRVHPSVRDAFQLDDDELESKYFNEEDLDSDVDDMEIASGRAKLHLEDDDDENLENLLDDDSDDEIIEVLSSGQASQLVKPGVSTNKNSLQHALRRLYNDFSSGLQLGAIQHDRDASVDAVSPVKTLSATSANALTQLSVTMQRASADITGSGHKRIRHPNDASGSLIRSDPINSNRSSVSPTRSPDHKRSRRQRFIGSTEDEQNHLKKLEFTQPDDKDANAIAAKMLSRKKRRKLKKKERKQRKREKKRVKRKKMKEKKRRAKERRRQNRLGKGRMAGDGLDDSSDSSSSDSSSSSYSSMSSSSDSDSFDLAAPQQHNVNGSSSASTSVSMSSSSSLVPSEGLGSNPASLHPKANAVVETAIGQNVSQRPKSEIQDDQHLPRLQNTAIPSHPKVLQEPNHAKESLIHNPKSDPLSVSRPQGPEQKSPLAKLPRHRPETHADPLRGSTSSGGTSEFSSVEPSTQLIQGPRSVDPHSPLCRPQGLRDAAEVKLPDTENQNSMRESDPSFWDNLKNDEPTSDQLLQKFNRSAVRTENLSEDAAATTASASMPSFPDRSPIRLEQSVHRRDLGSTQIAQTLPSPQKPIDLDPVEIINAGGDAVNDDQLASMQDNVNGDDDEPVQAVRSQNINVDAGPVSAITIVTSLAPSNSETLAETQIEGGFVATPFDAKSLDQVSTDSHGRNSNKEIIDNDSCQEPTDQSPGEGNVTQDVKSTSNLISAMPSEDASTMDKGEGRALASSEDQPTVEIVQSAEVCGVATSPSAEPEQPTPDIPEISLNCALTAKHQMAFRSVFNSLPTDETGAVRVRMFVSALFHDGTIADFLDLPLDIREPPVTGSRVDVQTVVSKIPSEGSATITFNNFLKFFSIDEDVRLAALGAASGRIQSVLEGIEKEKSVIESMPHSPDNRWFSRLDSALADTPPREDRPRPRSGRMLLMSQSPTAQESLANAKAAAPSPKSLESKFDGTQQAKAHSFNRRNFSSATQEMTPTGMALKQQADMAERAQQLIRGLTSHGRTVVGSTPDTIMDRMKSYVSNASSKGNGSSGVQPRPQLMHVASELPLKNKRSFYTTMGLSLSQQRSELEDELGKVENEVQNASPGTPESVRELFSFHRKMTKPRQTVKNLDLSPAASPASPSLFVEGPQHSHQVGSPLKSEYSQFETAAKYNVTNDGASKLDALGIHIPPAPKAVGINFAESVNRSAAMQLLSSLRESLSRQGSSPAKESPSGVFSMPPRSPPRSGREIALGQVSRNEMTQGPPATKTPDRESVLEVHATDDEKDSISESLDIVTKSALDMLKRLRATNTIPLTNPPSASKAGSSLQNRQPPQSPSFAYLSTSSRSNFGDSRVISSLARSFMHGNTSTSTPRSPVVDQATSVLGMLSSQKDSVEAEASPDET